MTSSQNSVV